MDPTHLEQIKQFLVEELMNNSKEQMCTLLELWERQKKDELSSSLKRSRRDLNPDCEAGHQRLFNDYFTDEPIYPNSILIV